MNALGNMQYHHAAVTVINRVMFILGFKLDETQVFFQEHLKMRKAL